MLGVAAVVCCACGIGGDMMQDLKVGHILGGTPARMQIAELISVVVVSFVLIAPIGGLHAAEVKAGGICAVVGSPDAELSLALAKQGSFLVHCLSADPTLRDAMRGTIRSRGMYGTVSAGALAATSSSAVMTRFLTILSGGRRRPRP